MKAMVDGDEVAEIAWRATGAPAHIEPKPGIEPSSIAEHEAAAEVGRLSRLTPFAYERERVAAADRLGIRIGVLDAAVKAQRAPEMDAGSGRALKFETIEPWPEPVQAADVLDEACALLAEHVVADAETLDGAAGWCALTHFVDYASLLPVAAIQAPERNCGKTVLLSTMGRFVPRPLQASNITPAALFRVVEVAAPTLLIDEADTFARDNDELRGILNSGHTRDSAFVIRTVEVNGDHEPRKFSTWGPKALAGIGALPPTILSRSIVLRLRRALPGERRKNLRHANPAPFEIVRRKFARWAQDDGRRFATLHPTCAGLSNRAADNAEPLLALADLAGGSWPQRMRAACLSLLGETDAASTAEKLLSDVRDAFDAERADRLSSARLLELLFAVEEAPWATCNKGRAMSARQLSTRLSAFGIAPSTVRFPNGSILKGYRCEQFADAWSRYLAALPLATSVTPLPAKSDGPSSETASVTSEVTATDRKALEESLRKDCAGVTDTEPPGGYV